MLFALPMARAAAERTPRLDSGRSLRESGMSFLAGRFLLLSMSGVLWFATILPLFLMDFQTKPRPKF